MCPQGRRPAGLSRRAGGRGQQRDAPAELCVAPGAPLFSLGWPGEARRWKGGVLRQVMRTDLDTLPPPETQATEKSEGGGKRMTKK